MVGILAALFSNGWNASAARHPNVLFLLADDLRPDAIGAAGNAIVKTPNIDRLMKQGLFFRNAYCLGSNGGAVCVPSRAQILTGRNLFHLKGPGWNPKAYPSTFARTMKEAGYATLRTGKLGSTPAGLYAEFEREFTVERSPLCCQTHANHTIGFIRENAGKKPFFAYVEFATPHDFQPAPPEYYAMYKAQDIPDPVDMLPFHPFDNGDMLVRDEQTLPWPRTRENVTGKIARYYASITWMDHEIGRILDALQASGEASNTIVVFAGDNGLSLGEHGLLGKQNLYEYGGMHVPLLFAGPGVTNGSTQSFAYLMDVFATVCDLAGIQKPDGLDSRSLAPVLHDPSASVRDRILTAYCGVQRSIRDRQWKLIRYPHIDKTQLFDLAADPHELKDLSADPAHKAELARMMDLLKETQTEFGDRAPLSVANPKPAAWAPPEHGGMKKGRGK